MVRALVTGGAGFIGSHLVDRLDDMGWNVEIVDNLSNGHLQSVRPSLRDSLWIQDFADENILDRVSCGSYDVIFHLAAMPRVSYSVEHPLETHEINVTRTLSLMDAARNNVHKFIFASSSSVYGGSDVLPTPEAQPRNPQSPYALQKAIIEDYLRLYSRLYGLNSVALRFFNVFGPRQLGGSPYSTAVSAWLTSIMRGQPMRSDGDGSQTRDMCYVSNVVDACVLAGSKTSTAGANVYNVACGDRTSNAEILAHLKKEFTGATSYEAPWRAGDVMHTQADIRRICEELGYTPRVMFWEGLNRTVSWYREDWLTVDAEIRSRCNIEN